jgi:hypothetical protein
MFQDMENELSQSLKVSKKEEEKNEKRPIVTHRNVKNPSPAEKSKITHQKREEKKKHDKEIEQKLKEFVDQEKEDKKKREK